jgi:hypothetical protein
MRTLARDWEITGKSTETAATVRLIITIFPDFTDKDH